MTGVSLSMAMGSCSSDYIQDADQEVESSESEAILPSKPIPDDPFPPTRLPISNVPQPSSYRPRWGPSVQTHELLDAEAGESL